jgi:hypothetical protein
VVPGWHLEPVDFASWRGGQHRSTNHPNGICTLGEGAAPLKRTDNTRSRAGRRAERLGRFPAYAQALGKPFGPGEEERRPRSHARTVFRRALERGNLVAAEAAAKELPWINLVGTARVGVRTRSE